MRERVIVREPSIHSNGWRSVEPGEKRQLLHVVGEFIRRIENRRRQRAAQRITYLQIVLAPGYLSDVAPRRRRIIAERIVHPFSHFMRDAVHVRRRVDENFAGVKITGAEG